MDQAAMSEAELPNHPRGAVVPSTTTAGRRVYTSADRPLQPDKAEVLRAVFLKDLQNEQQRGV
jgi:hypothetical protein